MDPSWLLTSTTYGMWLPGDARGFVKHADHSRYGDSLDADVPALEASARRTLKGPAVLLSVEQAAAVLAQFRDTAAHRHWSLLAVAVMSNHFHVVIHGNAQPERMLGDLKGYASRTLSRRWGKPASGTWWTTSGSRRTLKDEAAVADAVRYVQAQRRRLAVWVCHDEVSEP